MTKGSDLPFWKSKTLTEMTPEEWESLCDGCGRCCLHKLQDEETGVIYYTNVACRLLDIDSCRCTNYKERAKLIATCLTLTPDLAYQLSWLPETCAYRRLAVGKDLEWWHPLVSGDKNIVHELGFSVRYTAISENDVDMELLDDYVIED